MRKFLFLSIITLAALFSGCQKDETQEKIVSVTGVTLDKGSYSMYLSSPALTLTATVLPENAGNKEVVWGVTPTGIVTVDEKGRVKPEKVGMAAVYVVTADGGKKAVCNITVQEEPPVPVTGVTLDRNKLCMAASDMPHGLTATVFPANASNSSVKWTCNPVGVVKVTDGVVTPLSAGTATVTATTLDGSKTASCEVTVLEAFDPAALTQVLSKVAKWQISNYTYPNNRDFVSGTCYIGMFEWAEVACDISVTKWLMDRGQTLKWVVPSDSNPYHADNFPVAQFYLKMYSKYKDPVIYSSIKERLDYIIANPNTGPMIYPGTGSNQYRRWTWCDALFMAPAAYVHVANIENNHTKYTEFMDSEFRMTYNSLYDKTEKLWFRDNNYFNKTEANGAKVFWGRGQGWVAAGLVEILKYLPEDSPYRPFYEAHFKEFIPRLAQLQHTDGYWGASMLDVGSYPNPETSASGLIMYAIAYGLRTGLLDKETYYPVARKGWDALTAAVESSGKLGWVQPIGENPKNVTKDMTSPYGVGGLLLAGTELYRMTTNMD